MAEEEEDYMGDLSQFLPPEHASLPSTPSSHKVVSSNKTKTLIPQPSKNKPNFSNWQEHRKLKRAKQQHQEDQQTLANIESAIPQSNIGFKMLKQMGYTPGSALGKEGSGRAEPVGLEIRRGRGGLGREDPEKERMRKEEMRARKEEMRVMGKRVEEDELMAEFGCRLKEHWRSRRVVVNFRKAKGVLAQLGNEEVVEEEKKNKEGEDGGGDEEEEEEVITEEDLRDVLVRLRDEFHYCLFCGCQYESMEALLLNCPGTDEDDH